MILKTLISLSLLFGASIAFAQASSDKKLVIVDQSQAAALASAKDLEEAVLAVDRIEVQALDQQTAAVKKCEAGSACQLAIPHAVKISDLAVANSGMSGKIPKDINSVTDCRVCVAPTVSGVGSYMKELKATLKGMGKL